MGNTLISSINTGKGQNQEHFMNAHEFEHWWRGEEGLVDDIVWTGQKLDMFQELMCHHLNLLKQ